MRSLLIVEDEQMICEILSDGLAALGVEIAVAENGRVGLELLKKKSFDAVLCDIQMPELSGIELLTAVREAAIPSPFVFLTGCGEQKLILEALRLGAVDFLSKPFQIAEVLAVTQRVLEIGFRRKSILQMRATPGREDDVKAAEKMINLFSISNNLKRRG